MSVCYRTLPPNITYGKRKSLDSVPVRVPTEGHASQQRIIQPAIRTVIETRVRTGPVTYEKQLSSNGKYVSITAAFTATSLEQLDALYCSLHAHELVVMTL
jgi:putative lipoic acid-binding regulatory protein